MAEQFCFSCGAPTVALGQQVVPVCANCKARGVGEQLTTPEWMVRPVGGSRAAGPMNRIAVLNGIARETFGPDDHISAIGGEGLPIADHPDFRGCFIPGTADDMEVQRLRGEARKSARRAVQRRAMRLLLGSTMMCMAIGVLWVSANSRVLIFPEPVMVEVESVVGWWKKRATKGEHFPDVVTLGELPHSAWVKAQRPDTEGTAFHQSWAAHWTAARGDLETVRRGYLQSISGSPLDPMPLAGLVQVDAAMLYTRPELLGEINRAVSRLDVLNSKGPAVSAARAELALAQGNRERAQKETEWCVSADPVCDLLYAEATLDTAMLAALQKSLGPLPRVLRGMCSAGLAAQDWITTQECSSKLKRQPKSAATGLEYEAEMHAALGRWDEAMRASERAVRSGSERAEIRHLMASIAFAKNPKSFGLADVFSDLIQHPHLTGHTNREVVLVQATQLHIGLGDLAEARVLVDAALEAHPESHAARVLLADILYKEGRHGESEAVLRDIDPAGLSSQDAAMIHMWCARLYFEMGKQRLGRAEVENSLRLNPLAPFNHTELAWAAVTTNNVQGAIDSLANLVLLAPYRGLYRDPRSGLGLRYPEARRLAEPLLEAMARDVRFEGERAPTAAILSWWDRDQDNLEGLLEVLDNHPSHMTLQTAVAFSAFEAGRWQVAYDNALAVVSRRPSLAIMHSIRGRSLGKQGRWAEASDPLNRSVKGEAEQPELLLWAAEAWFEKGELGRAQDLISTAKKLAPWDPRIRLAQLALTSNGQ